MEEAKKPEKKKSIFTPERSVRFFIVSVIMNTVMAMIIWPLFELLFCKIENKPFEWTVMDGVVEPIMFGIFLTTFEFLLWKKPDRKEKDPK